MSWSTAYLHTAASALSIKQSGYLAAWTNTIAGNAGANALSMNATSGAATVTASLNPGTQAAGVVKEIGHGQFLSPLLASQEVGAGNWTVGFALSSQTTASAVSLTGRAVLYVINGATGAIRSTIFALTTIGAARNANTTYLTGYSTTVAGARVLLDDGDYFALEMGVRASWSGLAAPGNIRVRFDNTTAITADNVTNANPQSFLAAPQTIYVQGETKPFSPLLYAGYRM